MIVWGGYAGGSSFLNDGARYNPAGNSWTAVSTTGAPTARAYFAAVTLTLQQTFNDPAFQIPGVTPAAQIQNLVNAIGNLNYGQKQALYKNLGGKK